MSGYVIEGTWEEIKRHEAELIGQYLRVTVKPQKRATKKEVTAEQKPRSFLTVAKAAQLDGPPDWSENLESYLYDHASSD